MDSSAVFQTNPTTNTGSNGLSVLIKSSKEIKKSSTKLRKVFEKGIYQKKTQLSVLNRYKKRLESIQTQNDKKFTKKHRVKPKLPDIKKFAGGFLAPGTDPLKSIGSLAAFNAIRKGAKGDVLGALGPALVFAGITFGPSLLGHGVKSLFSGTKSLFSGGEPKPTSIRSGGVEGRTNTRNPLSRRIRNTESAIESASSGVKTTSRLGKAFGRFGKAIIPGVGAVLGAVDAGLRAQEGDITGAAIAGTSATLDALAAGSAATGIGLPIAGLLSIASFALDVTNLVRDLTGMSETESLKNKSKPNAQGRTVEAQDKDKNQLTFTKTLNSYEKVVGKFEQFSKNYVPISATSSRSSQGQQSITVPTFDGTLIGTGTFLMGSTGESSGPHFHIGPLDLYDPETDTYTGNETEQGKIDARDAAFKVAKGLIANGTPFTFSNAQISINPSSPPDDQTLMRYILQEQNAHRARSRGGSFGGIDIAGAQGTPLPLPVGRVVNSAHGWGYSARIIGTRAFVGHGLPTSTQTPMSQISPPGTTTVMLQAENRPNVIVAVGTNDYGDPAKVERETKQILETLISKGYNPILVPPNANGQFAAAHNAAVRAARSLNVTVENGTYESRDPLHLTTGSADAIRRKYPGAQIIGDSNAVRIYGANRSGSANNVRVVGAHGNQILTMARGLSTVGGGAAPVAAASQTRGGSYQAYQQPQQPVFVQLPPQQQQQVIIVRQPSSQISYEDSSQGGLENSFYIYKKILLNTLR